MSDISTAEALRHLRFADPTDRATLDRRRFLQLVGMGAGAGLVAGSGGSLLDWMIPGLDPSAWAAGPVGPNDGILVMLGLYGGNDGLNTVVPITDADYYSQRQWLNGDLAIAADDTLQLDSQSGLNKRLPALKQFWDAGQLAIVEGVGYLQQNLSHFSSMAYWMAGRPPGAGVPNTGWLGRWLDGYTDGNPDLFAAAEVGNSVPLYLIGSAARGTGVPA